RRVAAQSPVFDPHGLLLLVFFYCYRPHRDLHSFPTRRSSDLGAATTICAPAMMRRSLWIRYPQATRAGRLLSPGRASPRGTRLRSEEHTSELQSRENLVCRLLLEKKN